MKITYKKIQEHIIEPLPAVEVLREKIIFHAFEVESVTDLGGGDYELDIKVLPDRANDAKDERGMAREIAALFHLNLKEGDQYERGASLNFSMKKIASLLGRSMSEADLRRVFDAYHYQYEISGDTVTFFVPPWRNDLADVHDIADEVGRYLGYDTVDAILPVIEKGVVINPEFAAITAKRSDMIARGYHEVMTYSLVKKGDFQVAKGPKGKDFLRTNLLGELRKAYELNKQNAELLPNQSPNIFEIGRVFLKSGTPSADGSGGSQEELHIAWIDERGEHEEMLDSSAESNGVGYAFPESTHLKAGSFAPWSDYPFITRDIAVWMPSETDSMELVHVIKENSTDLLVREPRMFDTFSKDGKTSYAYRMIFQANDRTLTGDEIDTVIQTIHDQVRTKGWEVR